MKPAHPPLITKNGKLANSLLLYVGGWKSSCGYQPIVTCCVMQVHVVGMLHSLVPHLGTRTMFRVITLTFKIICVHCQFFLGCKFQYVGHNRGGTLKKRGAVAFWNLYPNTEEDEPWLGRDSQFPGPDCQTGLYIIIRRLCVCFDRSPREPARKSKEQHDCLIWTEIVNIH